MSIYQEHTLTAVLLSGVLVGGCQVNPADCDPSAGANIFSTAGCTSSGAYDYRIRSKQAELSSAQQLANELEQENRQLRVEKQQSSAQLAAAQNRLADLERGNTQLRRQIADIKTQNRAQLRQKQRLQSELQEVENRSNQIQRQAANGTISDTQLQREIAALEQRRRELERQRNDLLDAIVTAELQ